MSQNPERASLADALRDAVTVFEAPDSARLHGPAVRRGRQIRRRRAGAAVGGAVALGTAGVLVFALSGAVGHGTAVVVGSGTPSRAAASPSNTRPTPPTIRPGGITASVAVDALEYTLPSDVQVQQTVDPLPSVNAEVVDTSSHSWYVQATLTIGSSALLGTSVLVSVMHTAAADTCSTLNRAVGDGVGECTQSTVDGGKLLDEEVAPGGVPSHGPVEYFEWFSPTGYETHMELVATSAYNFVLTKAQVEAVMTNQLFGAMARALPADACLGGSFSNPVDPHKRGSTDPEHVRCSSDGKLYPTY